MAKQLNTTLSPNLINKYSSMNNSNKSNTGEFVSKLLHSVMQVHMFHLMSPSYAQHMALGGFYGDMPDLADGIAETLMGTEGKISGYSSTMTFDTTYNPIGFLNGLRQYVVSTRESVSTKTNFINQTDAVLDLIDSTLYKLKELK